MYSSIFATFVFCLFVCFPFCVLCRGKSRALRSPIFPFTQPLLKYGVILRVPSEILNPWIGLSDLMRPFYSKKLFNIIYMIFIYSPVLKNVAIWKYIGIIYIFSFLIRGTLFEEKIKGVYISFIFRVDGYIYVCVCVYIYICIYIYIYNVSIFLS